MNQPQKRGEAGEVSRIRESTRNGGGGFGFWALGMRNRSPNDCEEQDAAEDVDGHVEDVVADRAVGVVSSNDMIDRQCQFDDRTAADWSVRWWIEDAGHLLDRLVLPDGRNVVEYEGGADRRGVGDTDRYDKDGEPGNGGRSSGGGLLSGSFHAAAQYKVRAPRICIQKDRSSTTSNTCASPEQGVRSHPERRYEASAPGDQVTETWLPE